MPARLLALLALALAAAEEDKAAARPDCAAHRAELRSLVATGAHGAAVAAARAHGGSCTTPLDAAPARVLTSVAFFGREGRPAAEPRGVVGHEAVLAGGARRRVLGLEARHRGDLLLTGYAVGGDVVVSAAAEPSPPSRDSAAGGLRGARRLAPCGDHRAPPELVERGETCAAGADADRCASDAWTLNGYCRLSCGRCDATARAELEAQPGAPLALATNDRVVGAKRTLIVPICYSDDGDDCGDRGAAAFAAQLDAVAAAMAAHYAAASFGRLAMVVDVAPVTRAYDFPRATCADYGALGLWASTGSPQPGANLPTQAASRLEAEGAVDAWAYDFVVAWYPDICWGWAGVAYLPGTDAAVGGFGDLDWDLLVGVHEQGHNFGLGHASTVDDGSRGGAPYADGAAWSEYGSPYDPMGNGMAWGLGDAFAVSGRLLVDWAPADRVPVANPALCGDAGCAFALAAADDAAALDGDRPVGVRVATDVADTYFFVEYRAARAACVVSVGEVLLGRSWMPNTILTDAARDDASAWHLLEAGATVVVDAAAAGADARPVSVALALVGGAPVVTVSTDDAPATAAPSARACATLAYANQGCGAQGANLGTTFADANECALAARDVSACGNYVMWSVEYNAHWGCRCCAPGGELGGGANDLWDVFAYDCDPDDDGGAPPAPAPTAKPVASSPTAKPVSSPTAAEPPKDVFLYSNKNMGVYFLRWRAGAAAQPFSIQYQVKGTEDWIDDGVRVVEPEYDGTFYDILAPQHVPCDTKAKVRVGYAGVYVEAQKEKKLKC